MEGNSLLIKYEFFFKKKLQNCLAAPNKPLLHPKKNHQGLLPEPEPVTTACQKWFFGLGLVPVGTREGSLNPLY